jgi:hypothetical protein
MSSLLLLIINYALLVQVVISIVNIGLTMSVEEINKVKDGNNNNLNFLHK